MFICGYANVSLARRSGRILFIHGSEHRVRFKGFVTASDDFTVTRGVNANSSLVGNTCQTSIHLYFYFPPVTADNAYTPQKKKHHTDSVCNSGQGVKRHKHRDAISEKIKPSTKTWRAMFAPARNTRKRKVRNRSTRRNG